jgi:hypothetical protein
MIFLLSLEFGKQSFACKKGLEMVRVAVRGYGKRSLDKVVAPVKKKSPAEKKGRRR